MGDYVNSGKLISHVEDKITLIARAEDNEKAHFLTTAANAYSDFDYMAEADKTCSVVWNPGHVNAIDFQTLVGVVIDAADAMNLRKKLFVRGKSPADVGLEVPSVEHSLDRLADISEDDINIIHGIIGVITEAGEMAELLRDYLDGKPFDRVHVLEEAGDVYWYLARQLRGIHADMPMMGVANIDKLHGRHGESFDVFRDANRNLDAERKRLEVAAAPLFDERAERFADTAMAAVGRGPFSDDEIAVEGAKTARIEDAIMPELGGIGLGSIPPRVRNDPPLPAGVEPIHVGNGGENIGDGNRSN